MQKGFKGKVSDNLFYTVSIYDEKQDQIIHILENMSQITKHQKINKGKTRFSNSSETESE